MSQTNKGRVTISAVIVLENGRALNNKSIYNHMFDGHVYIPVPGSEDALSAFRYFNSGEPLETPYAYFVTAQVAAMPETLPAEVKDHSIVAEGLKPSEYKLIGDIRTLTKFSPVTDSGDDDAAPIVDPRVSAYVFACGVIERVHASDDRLSFKMTIEQYVGPLQGKAPITVNCVIDLSSARWAFLSKDVSKRKNFIKQGGYISVEGLLTGLDIIRGGQERGVALEVHVEDVTLLGRAPVPSTEVLEITNDSPLRGKGKKPTFVSTPLKFSYSAIPSPSSTLGKRRRVEAESSESSIEDGSVTGGTPPPPPPTQRHKLSESEE